jgi:vancomycin permeability regulator SanA
MLKDKKKMKTIKLIITCLMIALVGISSVFLVNYHVKNTTKNRIIAAEETIELDDIDCILILGCQVRPDGTLSMILRDRVECGIQVYNLGSAPKLLVSGDHGQTEYDEVNAMKQYAVDAGIPSEDVFMDHAGFSTYESIYRAKEVFQTNRIIIVTQEYHLYRALYIAEQLGLEAYGVAANGHDYAGQSMRDLRELLARVKDSAIAIIKPKPTYLGETIPITGSGDVTNDKN